MDLKNMIGTVLTKKEEGAVHDLTSPWGEKLDTHRVLQEYPRPQLRRPSYLNLNGWWDCAILDGEEKPLYEGEILVPFSPESRLSGVGHSLRPGELLRYRRTVTLEEIPAGKRLLLHFGAVDQRCQLYVNGENAGNHVGGYLPFELDITPFITAGENILTLLVWDDTGESHLSRGKQKLNPGGMFYTAQSGIWQTVWMEWVPEQYVTGLKITPEFDSGTVKVEWTLSRPVDAYAVVYAAVEGQPVASWSGSVNRTRLKLSDFRPWTPEDPFLYSLYLKVGEDVIESYFGMRAITVEPDERGKPRLCLNHKPYFQNGVLDQGYWPESLYTPPTDEAMIFDILAVKKLGFNLLRKHAKVEPLRWYYHCDRLGMLVWQDMVNGGGEIRSLWVTYLPTILRGMQTHFSDKWHRGVFGRRNREMREHWLRECEDTVRLLYNSPSVVLWVPFNEGWGQFDSEKVTAAIKKLDPTRPVDAASGWFDQGAGDCRSEHNYFRPLSVPEDPNRVSVISEYGGYACRVAGHSCRDKDYGYRKYPNPEELTAALKELFAQLPALEREGLSAAVFTQVSDIEEEVNGLMTYDRKVIKYRPAGI